VSYFTLSTEPIDHGNANAIRNALRIRRSHQLVGEMFRRSSSAVATSREGHLCHDAPCPLRRDEPVAASPGGRALNDRLQLSKNIRCFSNMRMLPWSASSSDSAISKRWPVLAFWPWGACRSGLYLTEGIIMRLIDDSGECDFLDNRWLWPRKAGAAICALMSTRPNLAGRRGGWIDREAAPDGGHDATECP
jgi:hypothetical protein